MKALVKMPGHTRLYRRGAVYYHRASIPRDIAKSYPKTSETFTLGTKDNSEALKLVRIAAVEVDARFEAHREKMSRLAAPQLEELSPDQIKQSKTAYYQHLLEEDEETRLDGFREGEDVEGPMFSMPSLMDLGGTQAENVLGDLSNKDKGAIGYNARVLRQMEGAEVRVNRNSYGIPSALYYRDTLPDDLGPMVILDASGRVRETYRCWEQRGGLKRLNTANKDYSGLEINLWAIGGGKSSWDRNGEQLLKGVAAAVNTKPDEEWLVLHHKDALEGKFRDQLRGSVDTAEGKLHFLHWGKHHGVNDFANVPNVILAGTQFLPQEISEGRARLAAGVPPDVDLAKRTLDAVTKGESADLILQGLLRASARVAVNGQCAPCTAYIIASSRSGIARLLPGIFPGCKVKPWRPIPSKRKGKVGTAIAFVEKHFRETLDEALPLKALQAYLGIPNKSNFNNKIRKHPEFIAALCDLNVEEYAVGSSRYHDALRKVQCLHGAGTWREAAHRKCIVNSMD